jgi:putative membrane protein
VSDLNDPRVFFAAERTLLAWNRTGLTLMAFGFAVERFGLFYHTLFPGQLEPLQREMSFWVGVGFVLLGAGSTGLAILQYRRVLKTLRPIEIPAGYRVNLGVLVNGLVATLGLALTAYLFHGHH